MWKGSQLSFMLAFRAIRRLKNCSFKVAVPQLIRSLKWVHSILLLTARILPWRNVKAFHWTYDRLKCSTNYLPVSSDIIGSLDLPGHIQPRHSFTANSSNQRAITCLPIAGARHSSIKTTGLFGPNSRPLQASVRIPLSVIMQPFDFCQDDDKFLLLFDFYYHLSLHLHPFRTIQTLRWSPDRLKKVFIFIFFISYCPTLVILHNYSSLY